jgi:hypothetical protein
VSGSGGVDSMLQFRLERGDDGMKHYRKMKRRHRAHLGSIGRKRDGVVTSVGGETTSRRRMGVDDASWTDANLTEPKK